MKLHHIVLEINVCTSDVVSTQEVVNTFWTSDVINDIKISDNETWLVTKEAVKERSNRYVS